MTTATETARVESPPWRLIVTAMSKTGGASIASGLLSAVGTKIIAAMLGPGSVALLQTLQQVRDGAVTAATANGRTALVQGASELTGVDRSEYLRTVAILFAGGTCLVLAMMLCLPGVFLRWSKLPATSEHLVPWLAGVVAMLSAFLFLTAILNSLREIGKLALLQLVSPLAAAIVAWPVAIQLRTGHPLAMVLFLAIPAAATLASATLVLGGHREQLREWFRGTGRWWTAGAGRHFLSVSGAMLTSGLVATSVLLAVRGSITREQSLAMTGQFDAAWNISMNQATLILGSVQTYYLPSLSSAKDGADRGRQIQGMFMVATLASVPLIVALASLKPLVVSLLYSKAFLASPQFLRWTLLGDYLKVSSWVLATPMLACRDWGAFLTLDLAAQALFWGSSIFLVRFFRAAEGAAAGFFLCYAAYFALCYGYARLRYGFRLSADGLAAWLVGLMLILGASASSWSDSSVRVDKAALWICLAALFSAGFAYTIRRREA